MAAGGNNWNDFADSHLAKFRATDITSRNQEEATASSSRLNIVSPTVTVLKYFKIQACSHQ